MYDILKKGVLFWASPFFCFTDSRGEIVRQIDENLYSVYLFFQRPIIQDKIMLMVPSGTLAPDSMPPDECAGGYQAVGFPADGTLDFVGFEFYGCLS